jgi:hypothetical protein
MSEVTMPDELERRYAEEVGIELSAMGLPPAYGKLLGWLLICDPPVQTSTQLAAGLGLSKGSVSTGMRMLERGGLVRRVATAERGHAYEMLPDALVRAIDPGTKFLVMQHAMDRGLALLGDETSPRAQRLRITRDFYAFIAGRIPELMTEFKRLNNL